VNPTLWLPSALGAGPGLVATMFLMDYLNADCDLAKTVGQPVCDVAEGNAGIGQLFAVAAPVAGMFYPPLVPILTLASGFTLVTGELAKTFCGNQQMNGSNLALGGQRMLIGGAGTAKWVAKEDGSGLEAGFKKFEKAVVCMFDAVAKGAPPTQSGLQAQMLACLNPTSPTFNIVGSVQGTINLPTNEDPQPLNNDAGSGDSWGLLLAGLGLLVSAAK